MGAPVRSAAWGTAVPAWQDMIRDRRTPMPALPLFEAEAERAVRIFKRLRIPDVPGMPTNGEACEPWVFDLVRAIFGSYDRETKRRMLREIFLLVPKKNAKSAMAAAIIVTAAILNERPEAELLLIAPTMTIAKIAFKQAWGIIRADAELEKLFHVREHMRTITHLVSRAEIAIKAADTDAITGGKATYTLIDETHEFAKKSKAADVFIEIRGALASRPDGFLMQITTQSKEPPAGVFKAELTRARAVRDGKIELPILPVLYELPPDLAEEWRNPETWGLVNPNLGVSVDGTFLADQLRAATEDGPAALALLASQHFNVEVGVGLKGDSWIGAEYWAGASFCGTGRSREEDAPCGLAALEALIARVEVAVVGIDGGGLDDLLGLSVFGRDRETSEWIAWFRAWAQSDVFERRKEISARLLDFEKDGDLVLLGPDNPAGDIEEIAEIVGRLLDADLLPEKAAIGLDPAGVSAIVDELDALGIADGQMVAIGQGYRLSPAIWGMERALKARKVRHYGQPLMDWVLGNAKTEQRGSAVVVTKEAAGKAKIDPLVAGFNAFQLMARNPVGKGPSVYDSRGILVV
ncbi:terminase large subunit [Pseudoroseicyclus sp. H15]